jgi:hypothetical protein
MLIAQRARISAQLPASTDVQWTKYNKHHKPTRTVLLEGLGPFLVPLAAFARHVGPRFAAVVVLLVIVRLLNGLSDTIFVVNVASLRQAITPMAYGRHLLDWPH